MERGVSKISMLINICEQLSEIEGIHFLWTVFVQIH